MPKTDKDKFISEKIATLIKEGYKPSQAAAISYSLYNKKYAQEGAEIKNTEAPQKPIERILYNVGTNEIKEGSLQPGNYTKVIYKDNSVDYLDASGYDLAKRMNNFRLYFESKKQPPQSNTVATLQEGDWYKNNPYFGNSFNPVMPQNDTSGGVYLDPNDLSYEGYKLDRGTRNRAAQNQSQNSAMYYDPTTGQYKDNYDENGNAINTNPSNDINRIKLANFYGGVGLEQAINYAARGFGEGDAGKASVGTGLGLLKLARNFMSGYGTGKEDRRVYDEMQKRLYEGNNSMEYAQEGGRKISNAELMTGHYLTEDPNGGNVNVEDGEYVKDMNTGNVQEVVGEKHKSGGTDVNLSDAKVLSDYTKIGAKNAKELKDRYNLKVKATDTFATVLDKFNKQAGVDEAIQEQAEYIEKLGKNESVKDATTKALNEQVLVKEIQEYQQKADTLKEVSNEVFEDLFARQEMIPKKAKPGEILDEKGKPMEQEDMEIAQEGGYIENLAKKYGISPERAKELAMLQEGGEAQQQEDPMQQVAMMVAEALSGGADPQEILQQLIQMGVPEEQGAQLIEAVAQELQGGSQQEGQPIQEEQPVMQQGGNFFSFQTQYQPKVEGYNVKGDAIINDSTLSGVEQMQPYTGKGYGAKMQDAQKTINLHSWYFDTQEKKDAFLKAAATKGESDEIRKFQTAYNEELAKRAKSAGLPEDEVKNIISQVGFTGKGVQQFDGKFGAFTSTRPLFDFSKVDGKVAVQEIKPDARDTSAQQVKTKTVVPNLPIDFLLPPSSMETPYKAEVALRRMEPTKITPEPMLVEQERQRRQMSNTLAASNLPESVKQALLAQSLGTTQGAANEAIGKAETFNAQAQQQADQFNIGQAAKEDLTNEQFNLDYERKVAQTLSNQERDLRSFFNELNDQQRYNYDWVDRRNMLNAMNEQFQTTGSDVLFMDNRPKNIGYTPINQTDWNKLSAEEQLKLTSSMTEALKKKNAYQQMNGN